MKDIERHSRSAARIASVQALYQMDASDIGVERAILEFSQYWMTGRKEALDEEGTAPLDLHHADREFFAILVRGVVEVQNRIDPYLERQLAKGWTLKRLDTTVRAILRAGLYELIRLPDTPVKVVLDEYINIAHAFFHEDEPKFINGVLDAAAKEARHDEMVV